MTIKDEYKEYNNNAYKRSPKMIDMWMYYEDYYMEYKKFIEIIKMWKDLYELDDVIYKKAVEGIYKEIVKKDNWEALTPKIVFKYIIRFLELWNVRNPPKDIEKIEKIVETIKCGCVRSCLKNLEGKTLISLDIDKHENDIKTLYDELQKINGIGATATTKILHLLNPNVVCNVGRRHQMALYQKEKSNI